MYETLWNLGHFVRDHWLFVNRIMENIGYLQLRLLHCTKVAIVPMRWLQAVLSISFWFDHFAFLFQTRNLGTTQYGKTLVEVVALASWFQFVCCCTYWFLAQSYTIGFTRQPLNGKHIQTSGFSNRGLSTTQDKTLQDWKIRYLTHWAKLPFAALSW